MALKNLKRSENTSEPLNRLWAGKRQRVKKKIIRHNSNSTKHLLTTVYPIKKRLLRLGNSPSRKIIN